MSDNGDPIGQAIAAAEARQVEPVQVPIVLQGTGRLVLITVPKDITGPELAETAATVLMSLRPYIDANFGQASPLIIARGKLPT